MVAKNSRAPVSGRNTPDALTLWSELPRRQLALISQSAAAVYRGSRAMRQVQQEAADRALAHQQQVTERLLAPMNPAEFMQLQSELLRFQLQESLQYWQQLTAAAVKAQQDMVAGAAEVMDAGEPSLDVLQRVFEASLDQTQAAASTAH
ncbi:MAG TPA: phasin family protein [Ramlibacter sp.]|nr:phasin family protein [Ramlibacter sp.]